MQESIQTLFTKNLLAWLHTIGYCFGKNYRYGVSVEYASRFW